MFRAYALIITRSKLHYTAHEIKLIVKQILCIKLVKYWDEYTEMQHGQQNVKTGELCWTLKMEAAECSETLVAVDHSTILKWSLKKKRRELWKREAG